MAGRRHGFQRLDVKGYLQAWEMHRAGRRRGRSIAARWAAAAGSEIAAHSRVRLLTRQGVLRVVVDSSALLQELVTYRRADLLERLNAEGATPALVDIRFEIGTIS